jgi:hypothetical protein
MAEAGRLNKAAGVETVVSTAEPLVGALQGLYRAYQKTSIYPTGHPAVPEALAQALNGFQSALTDREQLIVTVSPGHLQVDEIEIAEATETIGALANLLYELDIVAVEFLPGLVIKELEQFVHELGRAKRDGRKGVTLVQAMEQLGLAGVRPRAMDYEALQFGRGSRDPLNQQKRQEVWNNVTRILADPASGPVDLSPNELAAEITQEIKNNEGTGLGLLKKRVQSLSAKARRLSPERRAAINKRIASFVTALSPKLRRDLLHIDPTLPEDSLELMTAVAERLPESDLLRALQELDNMGARVPGQLLTLMNKLVRISRKHPSVAVGLRDRLKEWGVSPETLSGSPEELQEALQEVFHRRARADYYIPQPHKVLLDDLSRNHVDTAAFNFDGRYRLPDDEEDVQLHAAQVAVRVLGGRGGEKQRAGIFALLATGADSLIEQRHFEVVHDAAVSARTYSLLTNEPEGARRAARGFLEEFQKESRIERILERGCSEEGFARDALNLLGLGGKRALDRVLDFLDRPPAPEIARQLEEFVRTREPQLLAEALNERLERGWEALKPLIPLIGGLAPDAAVPLLEQLIEHEELRVRRQAYAALCDMDCTPETSLRYLRRALADVSAQVSGLAIQRLLAMEHESAIELLGAYIEDGLEQARSRPELARQAARGLLVKGDAGVERLCRSLDRLGRFPMPRRVRQAQVVVDTLRAVKDRKRVARSLGRWRFSPSGLMSLVLPGAEKVEAGGAT